MFELDSFFFFFFQAEDGIRDYKVTGVQTCALPISWEPLSEADRAAIGPVFPASRAELLSSWQELCARRSEERRVGKECRSRWSPEHWRNKEASKYSWTDVVEIYLMLRVVDLV